MTVVLKYSSRHFSITQRLLFQNAAYLTASTDPQTLEVRAVEMQSFPASLSGETSTG